MRHPSLVCCCGTVHGYIMGSGHSKPTVLDTMIKNFRKRFSENNRVKLALGRLKTLCDVISIGPSSSASPCFTINPSPQLKPHQKSHKPWLILCNPSSKSIGQLKNCQQLLSILFTIGKERQLGSLVRVHRLKLLSPRNTPRGTSPPLRDSTRSTDIRTPSSRRSKLGPKSL